MVMNNGAIERFVRLDHLERVIKQLCRYIPFEQLIQIVETKSLYFAKPFEAWDDKCEGYLYRALKDGSLITKREFIDIFNENERNEVIESINSCKYIRAMSWSHSYNDINLWMSYSYGDKAVMVVVNKDELLNLTYEYNGLTDEQFSDVFGKEGIQLQGFDLFDNAKKMPIFPQPITYVSEMSTHGELEELRESYDSQGGINWSYPIILGRKRSAFSFEKEIRVMINAPFFAGEKAKQGFVNIININKLIEGVMVHPKAPSYYENIVEEYCNNHKIRFLGKSKVLEFI